MDWEVAAGGSRALAELIDKHGEAILANLLSEYGVDLRDLFSEENPLSPKYVLSLIIQLPTNGAFYASRRGGIQFRGWDPKMYALVAGVNALKVNNYILACANRDPKKPKPPLPEMFPTPDDNKSNAPKPGSFAAIAASMMAAQRKKKELLNG